MNYELAKELKDAGWSQKIGLPLHPEYKELSGGIGQMVGYGEIVATPTLSELIEACGERFDVEIYPRSERRRSALGKGWYVRDRRTGNLYEDATLKEAVARLWLTLEAS